MGRGIYSRRACAAPSEKKFSGFSKKIPCDPVLAKGLIITSYLLRIIYRLVEFIKKGAVDVKVWTLI